MWNLEFFTTLQKIFKNYFERTEVFTLLAVNALLKSYVSPHVCFLVRTDRTLGTCLNRDGTLQPQVCMMPSSRRTCSRTCRYCSRRCSRRANIAESLRRDATPLLASLEEAGGREGKRRKKRSVSSLASQQQETKRREMKKRRQVKASAITTAKQSSKMTKSNVQFSVLRHKKRKLEASVSV